VENRRRHVVETNLVGAGSVGRCRRRLAG